MTQDVIDKLYCNLKFPTCDVLLDDAIFLCRNAMRIIEYKAILTLCHTTFSDSGVFKITPVRNCIVDSIFFVVVIELAKLYDKNSAAGCMYNLVENADALLDLDFDDAVKHEIADVIVNMRDFLHRNKSEIDNLIKHRNKMYAHNDITDDTLSSRYPVSNDSINNVLVASYEFCGFIIEQLTGVTDFDASRDFVEFVETSDGLRRYRPKLGVDGNMANYS